MNRLSDTNFCYTLLFVLALLVPATYLHAEAVSKPGQYCSPLTTDSRVLEELSITLDQVARAQHAMESETGAATDVALGRAASALTLASAYNDAARTRQLINAALTAKDSENYQQLLGWFPLLHKALLSLPDDPEVRAAGTQLGLAEDILQGDSKGDALKYLHTAAHYLGCDKLDIPLKQADEALTPLFVQVAQGHKAKSAAFDKVLVLLRAALNAAFEQQYNAANNP